LELIAQIDRYSKLIYNLMRTTLRRCSFVEGEWG